MIIPKLHYLSKEETSIEHLENIQKACASGAELIQLSLTNIKEKKAIKLAQEAREITSHFQTRLVIEDHYKIAKEIKADGVYFQQQDFSSTIVKKELYTWQSMGATANTLETCQDLIQKEVDYIGLGPFRLEGDKESQTNALGLDGYTAIAEILKSKTPLIGFGGITTTDINEILKTGISGVTVAEAIRKDFNSIRTFNQLLKASVTEEKRYVFKKNSPK